MNLALSREIYGQPWLVDSRSLPGLMAIMRAFRNGGNIELPETKYNTPFIASISSDSKVITREWQLDNSEDFEGVGLINLDGAITLSGGASSIGMEQLSDTMLKMSADKRVKAFVIRINSGGGSSSAVETMVDTINEVKKTKPVYASIKKGGMAGSAAYGIATAATKIFSEAKMNIVGSAGTMIEFEGVEANTTDPNGIKTIRLYATKSTRKNEEFEQAINNDNFELIVNDLLDPVNDNFLSMILANRPQLEGSNYDNGHTVFSKDAIGTFIDGIASFSEVLNMALTDAKEIQQTQSNILTINSNIKKMNRDELKQAHPETFNAIVNEGVTNERERVKSWLVYQKADSATVLEGINSGKEILPSQVHELSLKMMALNGIEALRQDSQPALQTNPSAIAEEKEDPRAEELKESANFELK